MSIGDKRTGFLRCSIVLAAIISLGACSPKNEQAPSSIEDKAPETKLNQEAQHIASLGAWELGTISLQATADEALALQQSIDNLLQENTQHALDQARDQWHISHNRYREAAIFLVIGESNPGLFGHLQTLNFNLDAWPIMPGFLDSFDVYTQSGIVNDITVPLNAESVRQQHGFTDDSEVTLGFHAIEYLLWGEGGQRPLADLLLQAGLISEPFHDGAIDIDQVVN
mgnify:CR=1 FL=1